MATEETLNAMEVLKKSSKYFSTMPVELMEMVAENMTQIKVEDGHVIHKEGEGLRDVLFVESGKLIRTRLSVPDDEKSSVLKGSIEEIKEKSIVIDELTPFSRPAGFLHIFEEEAVAFSTDSSCGPSTIWTISSEKMRTICTKPEFSMYVLSALAKDLRSASKSMRGLLSEVAANTDAANPNEIKILSYDSTSWVVENFNPAIEKFNKENEVQIRMEYTTERLSSKTASFAKGFDVVCLFVNDTADKDTIQILSNNGVKMIANRCAGFDRVDTAAALAFGISLARVPAYSPYAVAEMGISLLMGVNRKIAKASTRVKMANFSLDGGLMGTDIHGKTVGVMGTGKIGQILCGILKGFGVNLICFDVFEADAIKEMGGKYVTKEEIFKQSDIIFLMMPLLPPTKHTINESMLDQLKPGMILINSSRGGLVDTKAVLKGIKSGIISGYGADVYENEGDYFFQDWSAKSVQDPVLVALMAENKVLLTAHQAFFTQEAVDAIVNTTLSNVKLFKEGKTMYDHPNNFLPIRK